MKLGAVGVGAALGGGKIAFFGFGFDGLGSGRSVEEAFDIPRLHDVEAHQFGLCYQRGQNAMLVTGVRGDGDSGLSRPMVKKRTQSEVDLGVHQDDVRLLFEGCQAILGGRSDGVGGFNKNINGVLGKHFKEIVGMKRVREPRDSRPCRRTVLVASPSEFEAWGCIDLKGDRAPHGTAANDSDSYWGPLVQHRFSRKKTS